jgi:hypothetical protein
VNPFTRYGRIHLPACSSGGLRGHECQCPFMAACAVCGGVSFCHCLQRWEDLQRELAENAVNDIRWEQRVREQGCDVYQQWAESSEDDALDYERAHGYERRQQMADRDRRD